LSEAAAAECRVSETDRRVSVWVMHGRLVSRLGDHQLLVDDAAAQHRGSLVASRSSVYAAVGPVYYFFYRQDAPKRQTAGINFTHRPKTGFSPRRGDSLHQFMSNFAGPTGSWVCLAVQNFTSIGSGKWECGLKISKISTFW